MRAFSLPVRLIRAAAFAAALLGVANASAMTFRLESLGGGAQAIVAEGQITNSTPGEFVEFLRDNASNRAMRTVVFLHSEGGYVVASMELGSIFRRIGAATVVARLAPGGGQRFLSANCLSACVYAFMGGRKRVAPQGSALGIHRMFANQSVGGGFFGGGQTVRRYDNGSMAGHLMAYSARMGVSRDLIRTAEHISSSAIHVVTSQEMARWNLAGRVF